MLRAGEVEQACAQGLEWLANEPDDAECHHLVGIGFAAQNEWPVAKQHLRRAVELSAGRAAWWRDLGLSLIALREFADGAATLRRSIELSPEPGVLVYYAEALAGCRQIGEAIEAAETARQVALKAVTEPKTMATLEFRIGRILESLDLWQEAVEAYRRSLALDARAAGTWRKLETLYRSRSLSQKSIDCARQLARVTHYDTPSLWLLALALFDSGRLRAALLMYRRAAERDVASPALHSEIRYALLHDETQTGESLKAAHEKWISLFGGGTQTRTHFKNPRELDRKLKIGFPSGEFKLTPTIHFLLPLLQTIDRSQFEIYGYDLAGVDDEATLQFRKACDQWRSLGGKSSNEILSEVLRDEIDILMDLSGHFAPHALDVFHQRAAPVQVAYPNYPCTTGSRSFDFIISDIWTTPDAEAERQYSEGGVYRLPSGYLVFEPPVATKLEPLPALTNGYVTFGVFQRPSKYSSEFWDAAASILLRCQSSRLMVQCAIWDFEAADCWASKTMIHQLEKRGVEAERIDFVGYQTVASHLDVVARADIALDTWPYNGQTTTCSCLWMGVPVVSRAGKTHASRTTFGLLHRVGLGAWATESRDEYVDIAVRMSQDLTRLSELRLVLRDRFSESSICRPEAVTRDLEIAFRWMWKDWCSRESSGPPQDLLMAN